MLGAQIGLIKAQVMSLLAGMCDKPDAAGRKGRNESTQPLGQLGLGQRIQRMRGSGLGGFAMIAP